jgi:hypothetical protein
LEYIIVTLSGPVFQPATPADGILGEKRDWFSV